MKRRRAITLGLLITGLILGLAAWVTMHIEKTQYAVWSIVTEKVAERTCLQIEADEFGYRLWPARVFVNGLVVTDKNGGVLKVDSIAARWRWLDVLGNPTRLRLLEINGLEAAFDQLPSVCEQGPDTSQTNPWGVLSIDELVVRDTGLGAKGGGMMLSLEGVGLQGTLQDGTLDVDIVAHRAAATRMERRMEIGDIGVSLAANEAGIEIERLTIDRGPLTGEGAGAVHLAPELSAEGRFAITGDLRTLMTWWDPVYVQRLKPQGRLNIKSALAWDSSRGLRLSLDHSGPGVMIADYPVAKAVVAIADGTLTATASSPQWGRATATMAAGTHLDLDLDFDAADLRPAVEVAGFSLPPWIPPEARLSGRATAGLRLPFSIERLQAEADLEATWRHGRGTLRGGADNGTIVVKGAEVEYPGLRSHASGTIQPDGRISATGSLAIDDPDSISAAAFRMYPDLEAPELKGGPVLLDWSVSGTMSRPKFAVTALWDRPDIGGVSLDALEATAHGTLNEVVWRARVEGPGNSFAAAQGSADRGFNVAGSWEIGATDLGAATAVWATLPPPSISGALTGKGEFGLDGSTWFATGGLEAQNLTAGAFVAPAIGLDFAVGPSALDVPRFEASLLDGSVQGQALISLLDPEPQIDLRLAWNDLSPSAVIDDLPALAQGTSSGTMAASGPLSSPSGEGRFEWTATAASPAIETASFAVRLEDGTLRITSEEVRIASEPLIVSAVLPLGSLERPPWFAPDAPGGAWQLSIDGQRLHLAPVLASLGHDDIPADAVADLEARAQWHPEYGGAPQLQISLLDASVTGVGQVFVAQGPVRLAFDGREFVLGDVVLQGEHGYFAVGGSFDVAALEIDASAEGRLDPRLARLIPYPISIRHPMDVSAHVDGPIAALGGTISISHPNGVIEIRDPPIQVADLRLEASIRGGVVDIQEGQARVNEGTVYLGGGWNPSVKQGLVAELEDVLFLLGDGILTKWDGAIAVEPTDDGTALVVGELLLDQGLWDSPFDLASAFLGDPEEVVPADDITYAVALDLDVRGRGGIHVNNNLGTFDLRWNLLEVWGTLAEPHLGGDINILPGGTIRVAGQSIPLRRGLVQFTGDPLVDPLLEIVPEHDVMSSRDGKASGDVTQMATSGLAAGLGTVLGLENTTIRPEDIAIVTDSDTSTDFSIGQQLTHSTALFLTTDLRNSQKRTSLLQLWRIPSLPGLTVQGMTRTDPSEVDLRVLQRFSWGGTKATTTQPQLHKVQLDGEWPGSKRRFIKASGLFRDQPWDPFLLFLGTVRLERNLASRGYPEAVVTAVAEGPQRRPKAVFSCETGPQITVEFTGDKLPRKVRSRVVSLYRFPPLEEASLENMRTVILRHLWSEGHPEAQAELTVTGDGTIRAEVVEGDKRRLVGPFFEGVPPETAKSLATLLGSPTELAEVARKPARAERVVRRVLATAGYRDVQSVETWTEPLGETTSVRFRIEPGRQSLISELEIDGADPLGLTTQEGFVIQKGMPLDRGVIDGAVSNLRAAYRTQGYTEARVRTHLTELAAGSWALRLELDTGTTAQVARVDITGRRHLGDFSVRHGVAVKPGSLYRLEDLDETIGRLATFAPIERVDAMTHQENGEVVVDLNITEKNRWAVEIGGGWNSDRGATVRTGLKDANLFGRGAGLTLLGRWESDFLQGRAIFGMPPLPGGRITAGIIASYTEDVLTPEQEGDVLINEHISEATIEGTYQLSRKFLTRGYYRFSRTRTFEPDPFDPFWALDITTDLGVLGGQLILDRLDNPFDPRSGFYAGLDLSWAGEALGSDTQNIRTLLSTSMALEPRRDWTWFQSLRIGAARPINGILDRQSRFFAGGAASIRGFELDSVGPVEVLGGQAFYAGGEALFVLNEELRIPVWKSLRGAIFIDTGQVWETWSDADFSLAVGAGVGIRWGTPVGPLWADVAWPVANPGLNSGARFSFGIGRTF